MRVFNYFYHKINDNIQVHTTGCDNCISDARKFASTLNSTEKAIVYNTCSMIHDREVENRLILKVLEKAYPDHKLYVLGCAVNHKPEKYECFKNTFTNEDVAKIVNAEGVVDTGTSKDPVVRIKVQDGCHNRCSFCIVNQLRSKPYSVPYKTVYNDLKFMLKDKLNAQVVLAGTELTSYYDEVNKYNLVQLLEQLIKDFPEVSKFKISCVDPAPKVTEDLIIMLDKYRDRIIPFAPLAVQSGSDEVLKVMNRRHDVARIRYIHELAAKHNVSIGWDIIVGFPNETEERFQETYDLIMELKPLSPAVFIYSPREGTPAYLMEQIPEDIKQERQIKLLKAIESYVFESDTFNEYSEQLQKTAPVLRNKAKLIELIDDGSAHIVEVDLLNLDSVANMLANVDEHTVMYTKYIPEADLQCDVLLDFFRGFIEHVPVVCYVPKSMEHCITELEKLYHCIGRVSHD